MSLDDERTPWPAAEAIERGENPQRPDTAQFRLATLLAEHDDLHSIHHHMIVAGRVLAFLPRIVAWADEAKPTAAAKQLRQQQVAEADNETWFLEEAHYHLRGYRQAMAALKSMGSVYAKDFDPDEAADDAEDRRLAEQRHDQHAADNAPTGIAS